MDKITLKNMRFFAYHGVLSQEQVLGQNFFIDIELYMDLKEAGKTDKLDKTVDYSQIYELAKHITTGNRFDLIETLAETIAGEILLGYGMVDELVVRVRKPEVPIPGELDWAEVEIKRLRHES